MKKKETVIWGLSILIIIAYLAINWRSLLSENSRFLFTTIGVFVCLCLIMLYFIYEICEDLKKEMGFNLEDNLVEIRLLKEITSKQLGQMKSMNNKVKKIVIPEIKEIEETEKFDPDDADPIKVTSVGLDNASKEKKEAVKKILKKVPSKIVKKTKKKPKTNKKPIKKPAKKKKH